jgi:hypothetical protein
MMATFVELTDANNLDRKWVVNMDNVLLMAPVPATVSKRAHTLISFEQKEYSVSESIADIMKLADPKAVPTQGHWTLP